VESQGGNGRRNFDGGALPPGPSRIGRKESSPCLAGAEKAPNKANGIGAEAIVPQRVASDGFGFLPVNKANSGMELEFANLEDGRLARNCSLHRNRNAGAKVRSERAATRAM